MFVDELTIEAKAGAGGAGVVRWHREKFKPRGGPAGGDGGRGGDVYVEAVKDLNRLASYTGRKEFVAERGVDGKDKSRHGVAGEDLIIAVPVGSRVTDLTRRRTFELLKVGQRERILKGGAGGRGNEAFKSATNRAPEESTPGHPGEEGRFLIEVALVVEVGLVGLPNAGKSTLLNTLTNARSRVGAYPFTTLEPHLGDFYGHTIADIPGVIGGAAAGKGLGHKFLRHISRTNMLLHLISLEHEDPLSAYYTIRQELESYDGSLLDKEEWIVLTKKDLVKQSFIEDVVTALEKIEKRVFVVGQNDPDSYQTLARALARHLNTGD